MDIDKLWVATTLQTELVSVRTKFFSASTLVARRQRLSVLAFEDQGLTVMASVNGHGTHGMARAISSR